MLTIDGSVDAPVTVRTAENAYEFDSLPQQIKVLRKNLGCSIEISTDSAQSVSVVPETKMNNWFWGNLLFSGLAGMLVDGVTYNYQRPRYDTFVIQATDSMGYPKLSVERHPIAKSVIPRIYRHEVRLSGCFSPLYKNSFYRQFRDDLLTQHSLEHSESVTESLIESIGWSAEYFYRLNKWLAIGCLGGQSRSKNDFFANYDIVDSLSVSGGNMRTDNWYVMPSVKLNWAIMGGIQCYSKAAIGIQRQRMLFLPSERSNNLPELNEQKWKFAWQVSALGVEIGTRFKFFAEIGYGWQGVFNMGFSYSWSRQKEN